MSRKTILIVFGGRSPEHDVSLISASSVIRNIDKEKYNILKLGITKKGAWLLTDADEDEIKSGKWVDNITNVPAFLSPDTAANRLITLSRDNIYCTIDIDAVFPVLHGEHGEDGTIQGLFELAAIPYVGCGVRSSANCMDKATTKIILDNAGIKQAKSICITKMDFEKDAQTVINKAQQLSPYPLFVKPSGTGSSVGVFKVKDKDALQIALSQAFKYDSKVLVEEYIKGREVEVAVLGNDNPQASVCGEIVPANEFYDYDAKYVSDNSALHIPAKIDEQIASKVRSEAVKAFIATDCTGIARVDFFVTDCGDIMLNEINTLPGFTHISMYPKLFEATGIPYKELIDRLILLAFERAAK